MTKISPYHCPKCGKRGKWRSGVGFEHEMICFKCWEVWEPSEIKQIAQQEAENLIGQNGDGI
jgi:hypothetical protein